MKLTFTTMPKIEYLSVNEKVPARGYWDMTFLGDLLDDMPDSDRVVVIIPGAYQGSQEDIDAINFSLNLHEKVLVFITSDEEGKFDCEKLEHPDMIHYRQYGYCKNLFPIGYTSETRKHLKKIGIQERDVELFFAGQLNSDYRRELFSKIAFIKKSVLLGTDGFAQGFPPERYYDYLARARSVPAPAGHVSPDSFRFYEALEAGSRPIMFPDYLNKMFPDFPPLFKMPWTQHEGNLWFSWWIRKKLQLKQQVRKDLDINYAMTIIIPTSPIPSHPSTEIIDQTIKSIRHHTAMDIIITIDGVRPEQEHMRNDYIEYIRKLLWKCNFEYENVMPILFDKHVHQSGMMKKALEYIKTPLLLYVEHDTPLVTDMEIDWEDVCSTILQGKANVVRFHYEAQIPSEHEYLMLHDKDMPRYTATRQWSQRPHVAKTEFYRDVMKYFSENANCFIEDRLYTECERGDWETWRVCIYTPDGNIKRSLNLDGRGDDIKYDKEGQQIW